MKYINHSITVKIDSTEQIRYKSEISKINRRNTNQLRNFVLTNNTIYNFKKEEIKRTINNRKIGAIIMSKTSNQFVLKINGQYDYRFCSAQRWKIYKEIINLAEEYNFQKPQLHLVEDYQLQDYTLTSQKLSCKHPPHPIFFTQYEKSNLVIANLLQKDHRVLYIGSHQIYQVHPYQFKEVVNMRMGRFTSIVKNNYFQKYFIRKTIPKHLISCSQTKLRHIFSNYKQKNKKQRIHFIFQNPDEFIVITQCYHHSLRQELNNFYQFTDLQIKKICQKVLCLIIQQEIQQISIDNIIFNEKFQIIFTQFQHVKIQNYEKKKLMMSPQVYFKNKKSRLSIFWNLGVFLYYLIYGISPIPVQQNNRRQFYQKKMIRYDEKRKNSISKELNRFVQQLLDFNDENRFMKYINKNVSQCLVVSVLKHEWFLNG